MTLVAEENDTTVVLSSKEPTMKRYIIRKMEKTAVKKTDGQGVLSGTATATCLFGVEELWNEEIIYPMENSWIHHLYKWCEFILINKKIYGTSFIQ